METCGSDADLLAQYIAAFEKLDDLCDFAVPPNLRVGIDAYGSEQWQPQPVTTPPSALEALYQGLGLSGAGVARFPRLYETLILSYRWADVDLGTYRLLGNEPAEDLSPLLTAMRKDKYLFETLTANGFVPFGKGPDMDYDPVCFDFRQRRSGGDCRIVKFDHEAILCHGRIREVAELAPNFRSLVQRTLERAAARPTFLAPEQLVRPAAIDPPE
jgi:hypothetical protein